MKIGLVTVTYNSESVLADFLQSVKNQTYNNYCLYVVDNDSKDKTKKLLQAEANIQLINNEDNLGVAYANNQGVKLALKDGCEFVLLVNNDTVFEKESEPCSILLDLCSSCWATNAIPDSWKPSSMQAIFRNGGRCIAQKLLPDVPP